MDVCIELIILKAIGRAKRDLEFLCGKKIQDFTFFFFPPSHRKQAETFRIPTSLQ